MRTKTSVRMPSFFGPFLLAAGLLSVICYFYVIEANSLNTTMKVGTWGLCTRYRNNTGVVGPTSFCTSKTSSFTLNYVSNSTSAANGGINQFPLVADDATLFGLNGDTSTGSEIFPVFSSSATGAFWLHPISAIVAVLTVLSLITPPKYFGDENSRLHQLQKGGMVTIALGFVAIILAFITFCVDLAVIIPARDRLNAIPGISAKWGNIQWFALPSALVMIVAFVSVMMTASTNQYQDL